MKRFSKKQGLTLQWRLTLSSVALLSIACIILTFVFNHSASSELQNLEVQVIQLQPNTGADKTSEIEKSEDELPVKFNNSRSVVRNESIMTMALVILLAGGVTYYLTGKALDPLRKLSERMNSIQTQNLSQLVEVPDTEDEIAWLARSFNDMLCRLEQSFTMQKRFSANAAHELRTPLTVIQARLDMLRRKNENVPPEYTESLEIMTAQTERLTHLVEELLQMTRIETVEKSDKIILDDLVEEIFCDLDEIAKTKEIELCQFEGNGKTVGNDSLLYLAIYNLIENAIKYNRDGGKVTVRCFTDENDVVITVSDTGYGIPHEYCEQVFEPFFRVDKCHSRQMGGCGLGLSLTQAIVRLHSGKVQVLSSSPEGTTIQMALPKAEENGEKRKDR